MCEIFKICDVCLLEEKITISIQLTLKNFFFQVLHTSFNLNYILLFILYLINIRDNY